MSTFFWKHRVASSEIDVLGHASNVMFVKWMQDAAVAHSEHLGFTPSVHLRMGAGWVVRSHKIDYLGPVFEGQEVGIFTWVSAMDRIKSLRQYELYCTESKKLVGRAETLWAYIHYNKMKPMRIPTDISNAFGVYSQRPEPPIALR